MSRKSKPLFFLLFCIIILSLLATLAPISDLDNDGWLDSLVTEGFLLVPVLCSITGQFVLLTRFPAARLVVPQLFSRLLLPPPIHH